MNEIKSKISNNKLEVDYDPSVNLIEISIKDENAFWFVHLDKAKVNHLMKLLIQFKNDIK